MIAAVRKSSGFFIFIGGDVLKEYGKYVIIQRTRESIRDNALSANLKAGDKDHE